MSIDFIVSVYENFDNPSYVRDLYLFPYSVNIYLNKDEIVPFVYIGI